MSEWGNPPVKGTPQGEQTRGSETSQYPEEKKSTEIPLVVASERGPGRAPKQQESAGKLDHRG